MLTDTSSHTGSRQLNAYICLIITFSAAGIALALRLIARRLTKLRLWHDDYLAIVAFTCAAVWTGLVVWWLKLGLGLYLSEIDRPEEQVLEKSRMILWNVEIFYAFSLAFAKFSILAFYWRMFKTSNIKTPIKVLFVCTMVWLILRTFMAIFHCVPVRKFWIPSIEGVCNIDDSKFFFGTVLVHLVIDIAILALPVIEVQKLHLPISQRIGIMGMFGFGIFVCIASVVVLVYSIRYEAASPEMPWNVAPIIIWATVEVNLAIVSACLPMLRPIYLVVVRRPLTKNSSYGSRYNPNSQPATSHKLATLTIHNEVDKSESDSTHQLAGAARAGSISSDSSFDGHGNTTVIVGSADDRAGGAQTRAGRRGSANELQDLGGIVVTTEMGVSVSKI